MVWPNDTRVRGAVPARKAFIRPNASRLAFSRRVAALRARIALVRGCKPRKWYASEWKVILGFRSCFLFYPPLFVEEEMPRALEQLVERYDLRIL